MGMAVGGGLKAAAEERGTNAGAVARGANEEVLPPPFLDFPFLLFMVRRGAA